MIYNIELLCHSIIKFSKEKIIYFDPFKIDQNYKDADLIFITHSHYDHFSEEDILRVKKNSTKIIITSDLKEKTIDLGFDENDIIVVLPNQELEVDNIKIGIGICFDLRFPEYFRELTRKGAEIIFLPSHFNKSTGAIAWDVLTRARAIENQVYFCAVNQTGEKLCGDTKVISYTGEVLKSLDKEEGVLTVDIDLAEQAKYRQEMPILDD